jgi:hypothetical protein
MAVTTAYTDNSVRYFEKKDVFKKKDPLPCSQEPASGGRPGSCSQYRQGTASQHPYTQRDNSIITNFVAVSPLRKAPETTTITQYM